MEMQSEQFIPAPRQDVWDALNDTEVLRQSMPGCESFEATGDNEFDARITTKVGPVKARFKFKVQLTDVEPPVGYTIHGEGQGGAAGFAKGSASVRLTETDGGTLLGYSVQAKVGGKLAQLGARLIDGTARKMADAFFGNFITIVSGEAPDADSDNEDDNAGQAKE
ncbi:MAG: SRPBCC family protein [Pseudohongiellaceae bacterium]|jgi:carbon monoxide dehydrogenase subunit G